jgi:hypothetical protein
MTLPLFGDDVMREFVALSADNMPASADVQSGTSTVANGRTTVSYASRLTSPCRIASLGAQEREKYRADQRSIETIMALYFPAGAVIQLTDRIRVMGSTLTLDAPGSREWERIFDVVAIDGRGAAVEVQRRVIVKELL